MRNTFDKLFGYAHKAMKSVSEKINRNKGEDMNKDKMNIKSYDGSDAFYSGTDEEYAEFLENIDVKAEKSEPVENTQRINLNETINIQSVIDKFKKTADGIESGAKKIKETVVNKVDEFKAKKEAETVSDNDNSGIFGKAADTAEDIKDDLKSFVGESGIKEKVKATVENSAQRIENLKEDIASASEMSDRFDGVETKMEVTSSNLNELKQKAEELADKLNAIDAQSTDRMKTHEQNYDEIKKTLSELSENVADVKQVLNSVTKINDSLFDLKNTQLNTKNAVSELETSFVRLRKKCVLGVTVLSILSAIVIILEIILMLS